MSLSSDALHLITAKLGHHLASTASGKASAADAGAKIPSVQRAQLDTVLAHSWVSYRDGIIIQLAYGLASNTGIDLTQAHTGARSVAQSLGMLLAENHIRHVKDAYQNIAKNSRNLARGNLKEFDDFLAWASGASSEELAHCFEYACATVAATARPVLPMPELNKSKLTYAATVRLFVRLLSINSQGAFEQYSVAALLNAVIAEQAVAGHRVETKSLNASDKSSFAAGDVQVVSGNRVVEAFEVTANSWRSKLWGATKTIRDNDLARLHIVAAFPAAERKEVLEQLLKVPEDVSVLDVRRLVESLIAALTKPGRAAALSRLYEYLDRYQPDVGRVNAYVELISELELLESFSQGAADDLG